MAGKEPDNNLHSSFGTPTVTLGSPSRRLDVNAVPLKVLQEEMGAAIKKWVEQKGSLIEYCEESGMSKSTMRRIFLGEVVGSDILLRVLKSLGRTDVLVALTEGPPINPLDLMERKPKPATQVIKPVGFDSIQPARLDDIIKSKTLGSLGSNLLPGGGTKPVSKGGE